MTVSDLISILQTMPPAALVVLGEHNRETVVSVRKFDIALAALRKVQDEYRETYETVAGDENELQGVLLG
jgi:hypothetical protein